MNYFYEPKEQQRVLDARESFSGRLLSNPQFDETMAITGIIEREILKSGTFREKLADYAHAFARTENFDALKADSIIRDLFKARTGKTMNEMREALTTREEKLTDGQKQAAYDYASGVGEMIEKGNKILFHRAFTHQAQALATELGITDAGAKRLMKEEFATAAGKDLYEWGKSLEDEFYRPQIEAEKQKSKHVRVATNVRAAVVTALMIDPTTAAPALNSATIRVIARPEVEAVARALVRGPEAK